MNARSWLRTRPWKRTSAKSQRYLLRLEELETRALPSASPQGILASTLLTTSTNWSGYAVQTNLNSPASGAFTSVSGSWQVPAVTGTGTAYSSFWVGLDGFSSNTVEQIGTDSDVYNGVPTYYAWYEMYPKGSVNLSMPIHAGDTINASVTYIGNNQFSLQISDVTTGGSFSILQTMKGAARSSAEWIAEAPSSYSGVLPLANFGTVNFSNASATIGNTTSGPIDGAAWQNAAINMTYGSATIATTSGLSDATNNGVTTSNFSVTYSPPPAPTSPGRHRHSSWFVPDAPATQLLATAATQTTTSANGLSQATTVAAVAGTPSFVYTQPVAGSAAHQATVTTYASYYIEGAASTTGINQNSAPKKDAPERGGPPAVDLHYASTGDRGDAFGGPTTAAALGDYLGGAFVDQDHGSDVAPGVLNSADTGGSEYESDFLSSAELAALVIGAYVVLPPQEMEPSSKRQQKWLR